MLQRFRKPLIVLTPKSLLRHSQCVSPLTDFEFHAFSTLLMDCEAEPADITRLLLCSGKVYYDLKKELAGKQHDNTALVRLEQLYPRDDAELQQLLEPFHDGTPAVWVQEEPVNQGAWQTLRHHWGTHLLDRFPLSVVARAESASPATGSRASHQYEQSQLVQQAFSARPN